MNIENKIEKNVPLAPLTTYKIGGPAEFFIRVKTANELEEAVKWVGEKKYEITMLGSGSNVLISDNGIKGLVITMGNKEIKVKGERIESGAGALLSGAVSEATSASLTGFEWATGVPGTVGGAIRGNAGCFGSNISEVIETVKVYNRGKNKFLIFSKRDCDFSYRTSIFKLKPELIIFEACFRLKRGEQNSIINSIKEINQKRAQAFPNLPSAGSVFKNLRVEDLEKDNPELVKRLLGKNVIRDGMVGTKCLINELDLAGKTIGGAKISLQHANFIVNTGDAKAEDVVILISFIKEQIRSKLHIQLKEEIQYLGF